MLSLRPSDFIYIMKGFKLAYLLCKLNTTPYRELLTLSTIYAIFKEQFA